MPFQDELDALSDSKYEAYLSANTYQAPGMDGYRFTGYHYHPTPHGSELIMSDNSFCNLCS